MTRPIVCVVFSSPLSARMDLHSDVALAGLDTMGSLHETSSKLVELDEKAYTRPVFKAPAWSGLVEIS